MKDKIYGEILDVIKKTKDFTIDQAPEVAKELIIYTKIESAIFSFIGFVLFFAFPIWIFLYCTDSIVLFDTFGDGTSTGDLNKTGVIFGFISFVSTLVGLTCFTCNISILVKVFVAPKLYILDYFTRRR